MEGAHWWWGWSGCHNLHRVQLIQGDVITLVAVIEDNGEQEGDRALLDSLDRTKVQTGILKIDSHALTDTEST